MSLSLSVSLSHCFSEEHVQLLVDPSHNKRMLSRGRVMGDSPIGNRSDGAILQHGFKYRWIDSVIDGQTEWLQNIHWRPLIYLDGPTR